MLGRLLIPTWKKLIEQFMKIKRGERWHCCMPMKTSLSRVVQSIRGYGHDVLTSFEAGKANQRILDSEVLAFSTEQGRTLLTLNRHDFNQLHNQNPDHAGIIVCTQDVDIQGQAERIHLAISLHESLVGKLIRVQHE